jgi:hypothetical protein
MASNPIMTIDPNSAYVQGLAIAQQQQQGAPPVNVLAQPAAQAPNPTAAPTPPPQAPQPMQDSSGLPAAQLPQHGGFINALGRVNDQLSALFGVKPTYQPWQRENDARQALAAWASNPNDKQAQANYLAIDPTGAVNNMQALRQNQLAAQRAGLDLQATQRANAQAAVGRAATILKGVRDSNGDVGAAYDQLRASGQLDPIGMHPGEHDYYRDLIVKTPGVLDQLAAAPDTVKVSGGASAPETVLNTRTGSTVGTGISGTVPIESDQRPLFTPGSGGVASSSSSSAAPAAGGSASSGPLSIVAGNNPGALRDGPFAKSQPGYTGADANGFATFKTPGAGIVAQERLLMGSKYLGGGNNTVNGIVDTYLGSGDKENSPESRANYKKSVAAQLGVAPDAALSGQQLRPLAAAMRNFETGAKSNGVPVTSAGSISRGATAPADEALPNGFTWGGSETIGKLDPAALHQAAQQYVLTGALPTALGRGGVTQKQILNEVANMGYTAPQIQAIQARTASDVGAQKALGAAASTIQAQEGAAQNNADLVLQKASSVYRGSTPVFNEWRNATDRHTGDAKITALDAAIGTFVSQFATVMGGGQPTDHLQKEWEDKISAQQSPEQLKGVIATMKQDMANRSKSYADRYNETTARISNSLPVPVNSPDEARALPKGTVFITHDGRFKTR